MLPNFRVNSIMLNKTFFHLLKSAKGCFSYIPNIMLDLKTNLDSPSSEVM